jgi:hypothetical protein
MLLPEVHLIEWTEEAAVRNRIAVAHTLDAVFEHEEVGVGLGAHRAGVSRRRVVFQMCRSVQGETPL